MERAFFAPEEDGGRGWEPKKTAYMGDSEDDAPIADMGAKFIVPFFASEEFRNHMASKHDAFVPKNEGDLYDFLMKG
jgi:hypothetical protein